jgi:hypothetical protein
VFGRTSHKALHFFALLKEKANEEYIWFSHKRNGELSTVNEEACRSMRYISLTIHISLFGETKVEEFSTLHFFPSHTPSYRAQLSVNFFILLA